MVVIPVAVVVPVRWVVVANPPFRSPASVGGVAVAVVAVAVVWF